MPPKSSHVSDPVLAPFLRPEFDPAEYLNLTLPALTSPSSLTTLSSETQTLLSTLNSQATRLTQTLTQLTDEILRSGSRLAYQVDVLRGESTSLNESLEERLKGDINVFATEDPKTRPINGVNGISTNGSKLENETYPGLSANEPAHISRLRLLTDVRNRLDSVIQLFGSSLAWPAPHSNTSSGFISVSAPPASEAEAKAKEYAETLKSDLLSLISSGNEKEALARVEEMRTMLGVWKGTAEERSREKFVTELTKLVNEKVEEKREKDREKDITAGMTPSSRRNTGRTRAGSRAQREPQQQLQERRPSPMSHAGPYLDGLF
jgi:hypothetical protein